MILSAPVEKKTKVVVEIEEPSDEVQEMEEDKPSASDNILKIKPAISKDKARNRVRAKKRIRSAK
jgi:hypothetical protein